MQWIYYRKTLQKIPEIASAISDCKFIVLFVIRYSMLHETFMDSQAARRKHDPTASMLGLKNFPDTRFAYAFFMIFSVFVILVRFDCFA